MQMIKLTGFSGTATVLGKPRPVVYEQDRTVVVGDMTVDEARAVLAVLAHVSPEEAAAALLAADGEQVRAAAAPIESAVKAEEARRALMEKQLGPKAEAKPAAKPKTITVVVDPVSSKPLTTSAQPAPAASIVDETDELEEVDDENQDDDSASLADVLDDVVLKADKAGTVFRHLYASGKFPTLQTLADFCLRNQARIPILAKVPQLETKVARAWGILTDPTKNGA